MKRIVSLLLAVSMVLSMFVTAFAATTYPDLVGNNAKFAAAVDALTELKVVNGFPDGEFKPGNELTRAELAKMLVICLGLGEQVDALATRTVFSDVPASNWAAGYINAAAQSKVILGYPDGTFKPDKKVSYAEAFTMALRALGYGNVVEAEGTWPTAYMLKAVELELTDDMDGEVKPDAASLRGNTAILLWNMLRTPMWRITEESETNGMTLSDRNGRIMLNVKFPNYWYYDADDVEGGIHLTSVDVTDYEEVTGTLNNAVTAKIRNVDLSKLVDGMKVSALVKDYKDEDKATFLTITPANPIVAGFVEEMKVDKNNKTTFKVDGTEYRFQDDVLDALELEPASYMVFEADGKKVNIYDEKYVARFLPTEGTYAKSTGVVESDIDDDALVIIDGEWAKVDDVEVGSVYTEVPATSGTYWMVNSESEKTTFDLMFDDKQDWDGGKVEVEYLTLADNDMRVAPGFKAYEKENNTAEVPAAKLKVKVKDNDYSDNEVEVFYNYLDLPVRMHFGEVGKNKNAGFYAVTSNGAPSEGSLKGKIYNMTLVGQAGEEEEVSTVVGIDMPGRLASNTDVYEIFDEEGPTFVWAKMDDNGDVEELVLLEDGVTSGEPEEYKSKYAIASVNEGAKITDKKLATSAGELTVQKSAYFFEVTAEKNDKDKIETLSVEVTADRSEYEDTALPAGTLVAYDTENDNKIKYVFLAGATESKLQWGKVNAINTTKETVELDTTSAAKLGDANGNVNEDAAKGDLVNYTLDKDETKASIKGIYDLDDLDEAMVIDGNKVADMEAEDLEDYLPLVGGGNFTLDSDENEFKDHKKYGVWVVTLKGRVGEDLEVSGVRKAEGKGHAGAAEEAESWDRVVVLDDEQSILVFKHTSFSEEVTTRGGKLVRADATEPVDDPTNQDDSDKLNQDDSDKLNQDDSDKLNQDDSDKLNQDDSDKLNQDDSDKLNQDDSDRLNQDDSDKLNQDDSDKLNQDDSDPTNPGSSN
jgi:hypothetical protein